MQDLIVPVNLKIVTFEPFLGAKKWHDRAKQLTCPLDKRVLDLFIKDPSSIPEILEKEWKKCYDQTRCNLHFSFYGKIMRDGGFYKFWAMTRAVRSPEYRDIGNGWSVTVAYFSDEVNSRYYPGLVYTQ